ncbi:MAG TPA: HPF/RaiA family ribosome-associated protein [Xanthobacteraceae bacterium]|nr:HPF/RaiA family ribosome-associated protein [Xanthobacteraceae bacterium]
MVQVPVEIAFHNLDPVPWAEEEIRARIAKLEKIYDRIVTCRVRVDQRANNTARNIPPVVRIEIGVPGREDLVVAHEPDRLQERFQTPDLHNAINEAFRIAEDQLSEYKRALQERGREAPTNDPSHQFLGQIAEIDPDGEFGFILTKEGGLLYFHRNSVLTGDFSALRRGDEVHYVEEMGDTGPVASKVRVKEAG